MSANDSGGEKTEQPTSKRLRDARRDGDVAKSRDLTQTVTTLVWTLLLLGLSGFFADRISALLEYSWTQVDLSSPHAMLDAGVAAARTLVLLTIVPLTIVGACGLIAEFLQTGGVFAPKRLLPQFSRLNPAEGVKRLFSLEHVVEIAKSLLKTFVLGALLFIVVRHYLPDILKIPAAGLSAYMGLDRRLLLIFCAWMIVVFAFVAIGDRLFQQFSHRKRLRMSKQDIRRERKEQDGDPHLRGQRRRLQRQWSTQNARQAAREATALVVNPTHIAIAIRYDAIETAVPLITAKGEGNLAKLMRFEAEQAGVPVIRDVPLARALHLRADEDDFIPEEYFEAIAEIIAWAERSREAVSG